MIFMNNIIAKKRYGQNFLVNQNVLNLISENIKANEKDLIVEIGPGTGNLTKILKQSKAFILCYEVDFSLEKYLKLLENEKTIIKYEDFLKVNLSEDVEKIEFKNIYLIANIPYYITTPILKKIISSKIKFSEIILMVQKEFADRLSSKAGESSYGSITVLMNYYFEINELLTVPKSSFVPAPKVDSAIIKLTPIKRSVEAIDYPFFEKIVKEAFQFRRKNIKNNLKNYDLTKIETYLNKKGKSISLRPQNLTVDEYIELSNIIKDN